MEGKDDSGVYFDPSIMPDPSSDDYSDSLVEGESRLQFNDKEEAGREGRGVGSLRDNSELPDSLDEYDPNQLGIEEEFCIYCRAELPHSPTELCAKTKESVEPATLAGVIDSMADLIPTEPGVRGRPTIDNGADMKDPISTGRKRAANAAPIVVGLVCEWAYLSSAGGGAEPIRGCIGYPATDRHHGPNKATLDNSTMENPAEDGTWNLHRICAMCHNRWHSANDKYYHEPRPRENTIWLPMSEYKQHDPETKMSKVDAFMLEATRGQTIGD